MAQDTIELLKVLFPKKALINGKQLIKTVLNYKTLK